MTMTTIEIKNLNDALDYDKNNLPRRQALVKADIQKAKQEIAKENNPRPELQQIYYKLALYELFINRNKVESTKYLKYYQANFSAEQKNSFAYAETLNLLGHAETITGTFNNPSLFEQALQILDPKAAKSNEEEKAIARERAAAIRYIGLCHHRSYMADKKSDDLNQARSLFSLSLEIYNQCTALDEPCVQRAESTHLLATTWREAGDLQKAHDLFEVAHKEEEKYVEQYAPHFILNITRQNLGDVKKRLALKETDSEKAAKLFEEAIELLRLAEKDQRASFDVENDDLAKTLQFYGDILLASKKNYQLATEKLVAALALKWKLLEDKNSRLIKFAHESLLELLNDLSSKYKDHPLVDECLKHFSNMNTATLNEAAKNSLIQLQFKVAQDYRDLKNNFLSFYFEGQAHKTENNLPAALAKFRDAKRIAPDDQLPLILEAYKDVSTKISATASRGVGMSAQANASVPANTDSTATVQQERKNTFAM